MTKALFINGSPRKNGNTAQLLKRAMDGAREAGAEVELVNLYDHSLNYKGCMSCFACKLKGGKKGVCSFKDDLQPILQKAVEADVLVCGSPNYCGYPSAALITGANNPQGIGATTAFAFAREGAKVVLVYKRIPRPFDKTKTDRNGADRYFQANAGNADTVESKLQEMGADYLIIESDISNEYAVKDIYAAILERYGKIDILVNNAADGDMDGLDTIEKITQNIIDDTFAVNVRGSILMTGEFIKHRGDYGRIINLSTDAAQVFAGQIIYGASKATLEALTRSIALEVAKYGITVNAVAPGPTQTGWIDDDFAKEVIPIIPMGKLIQPQDIAETILFLASEQARMITGQVIKVSGGHAL